MQKIWASLVPLYSRSNLSFPEDKLPAISGIARRLQKISWKLIPDDYLCGLWRPGLIDQLLWKSDLKPNRGRAVEYRAPSWSWASLDAQIYVNTSRVKDCPVELVDVEVKLKTSDRFGEVFGGSIILSGPLCMVTCVRSPNGDLFLEIDGNLYPRQLIQTDWDSIPAGSDTQESIIFSDFSPKPIYFLAFYPYHKPAEDIKMLGLILEPTGKKDGQYSRLGLFRLWPRHPEAHGVLAGAFRAKTLGTNAYLEFDGEDKYWVELV